MLGSGNIIALEIDPFSERNLDCKENDQEAKDQLFIIDDQFQIWKICESDEDSDPYEAFQR